MNSLSASAITILEMLHNHPLPSLLQPRSERFFHYSREHPLASILLPQIQNGKSKSRSWRQNAKYWTQEKQSNSIWSPCAKHTRRKSLTSPACIFGILFILFFFHDALFDGFVLFVFDVVVRGGLGAWAGPTWHFLWGDEELVIEECSEINVLTVEV